MSPDDHAQLIPLKKLMHDIWPELNNIARPLRIPHGIRDNPQLRIRLRGIRPQYIQHNLLLMRTHLMVDLQRPLNIRNVIDRLDRRANPPVQTQYLILNDRSQRQPIKQPVHSPEDGGFVLGVFHAFLGTLITETEAAVDLVVLVVASDEVDLFGEEGFEGEQEADGLEGVAATVHEIT